MITKFKIFESSELDWQLIDAIEFDNKVDKVKKLVEQGADINFFSPETDWSPIMYAIVKYRVEILEYLINAGADINLQDIYGKTPLMITAEQESWHLLQIMIESGADWFIKDKHGDYFVDYLSDQLLTMVKEDYPEKYEEYLTRKKADKYNL